MAYDLNPIASNGSMGMPTTPAIGAAGGTGATAPTGIAGGITNMVNSLMKGYQNGQKQAQGAAGAPPMDPMSISPPNGSMPWQPANAGGVPYAGAGPWGIGPSPSDNAMVAMMSSPPASPYGAGSANAIY